MYKNARCGIAIVLLVLRVDISRVKCQVSRKSAPRFRVQCFRVMYFTTRSVLSGTCRRGGRERIFRIFKFPSTTTVTRYRLTWVGTSIYAGNPICAFAVPR